MSPRAIPPEYNNPCKVETSEQMPEAPPHDPPPQPINVVQDDGEGPIHLEGSVEHFIHVILKNKYNEIHPNNPNGFVTIDMWIHNQTSTKYVELREFGVYRSMSDLELWHSLILHYGRIVYRQLMSMEPPDQVVS